jgi:hypothetical protein
LRGEQKVQSFGDAGLALAMIAALLLAIVGVRWAIRGDAANRRRGLLMIAAAVVLVANVVIWTL